MKRNLKESMAEIVAAAETFIEKVKAPALTEVECCGEKLSIKNGKVVGGDFDGYDMRLATELIPKAKDENGNWLIEAMVMPLIEKHLVFSVDGSLSREGAYELVEDFLSTKPIDVSGDVQGMFDALIVNSEEEGRKIKTIEETRATLGYCSADLYTAKSGIYKGDVRSTEFYHDEWKDGSDEYFSIDWSAAQD